MADKRPMEHVLHLSRNIIQGAMGGLFAGSIVGLIEAIYLLSSSGAPDLLSPFYAVVLYGLIGLGFGLGGGIALTIAEKLFKKLNRQDEAFAFAVGEVFAILPIAGFVLMYIVRKVVFHEQGLPVTGLAGIAITLLVVCGLAMTLGVGMLRGPFKFLLQGKGALGAWLGLAAATFGLSFVPTGADPRASWDHDKPVPADLKDAPNVLVIAIDTLRADYLGMYGKDGDLSPVLDSIGADGVIFEDHFAHASWTRSSFASLWTSQLPSGHNSGTKAAMLPDDLVLMSEALQDAGVTTANLANNINVTSTFNFDQGYDTFIYESPDYAFGATESVFGLTFYKVIHKLHERMGGAKSVSSFYQPAEVVLDDAKGFIEANKDSRWMLGVHLMEPHDPYFEHPYLDGSGDAEFNGVGFARAEVESPELSQADYLKKVYVDEIKHMDLKLKPFIEWMKAEGLYDDTVIVITADHGEEFGEHGGFWHGVTLYEEQIHIPLVIKLAGNELAGTRVDWQSRAIDVAPTITSLMGVSAPDQWQGADLLADVRKELEQTAADAKVVEDLKARVAELQGAVEARPRDAELKASLEAAQADLVNAETADECAAYKKALERMVIAEEDFEGNVISAIRADGFKYLRANEGNPRGLPTEELFDMVTDAGETKNLMGDDGKICGIYVSDLPKSLGQTMGDEIVKAASTGATGGTAEMSDAEKAKLCALGYLSGPDCE